MENKIIIKNLKRQLDQVVLHEQVKNVLPLVTI
jgi:hypothetical protein